MSAEAILFYVGLLLMFSAMVIFEIVKDPSRKVFMLPGRLFPIGLLMFLSSVIYRALMGAAS